jgi:hypothetical protein
MPISGTGTSSNQSPGSGFAFTNALILAAMFASGLGVICYSLFVIRLKGMKSNFISHPLSKYKIRLPSNSNTH